MRTKDPEKMKKIAECVDTFFERHRRAPSIREIAAETGIPRPTVQRYLVGMEERGLLEYSGGRPVTPRMRRAGSGVRRLPLLGLIACGEFRGEEEWQGETVDFPAEFLKDDPYFILLADGDSMTGAGIDQGDYVVIRKTDTAPYGSIVVALDCEKRNTLKRLCYDKKRKRPYLHPENENYPDLYPAELSIQGVAEKVLKDLG